MTVHISVLHVLIKLNVLYVSKDIRINLGPVYSFALRVTLEIKI
jgi:hypothetical protein